MVKYVAAIDQGTTGTRCIIFDKGSNVIAASYHEHEQIYPSPGWVEHNPLEIWEKTKRVVHQVLSSTHIAPEEIAGIGLTNQRETVVVWNRKTGIPLHNAIVWQCTRSVDICEQMEKDGLGPIVSSKTGLLIATYFSGSKIKWLFDNIPGLKEKGRRGEILVGNIDTWLIWNLTGGPLSGVHVTDYTNASRTMLMNLETLDWDDDLLAYFGIPRQTLPQIRQSSDERFYGKTTRDGPFQTQIPVCGDLGDQQAALFGQTCFSPGEGKNTYGTGNFLLLNTGAKIIRSKRGLLSTVGYGLEEGKVNYALEGSIAVTGAAIQWLRDNLCIISDAAETEKIALSVEDSGGVYFVPAFSGLFAPYWDMYARGAILGLTRYSKKAHIVRAALEAIAFQTKDVLEAMIQDFGKSIETLKVDGGAIDNEFLMQFQADMLGIPIIKPHVKEITSLGAAYAAGLATGFWENPDELRKNWRAEKIYEPTRNNKERDERYRNWKKAVEKAKGWIE
ncbi:MAG: glycerol kinase GlpK [Candidatus Aenigmarchaeota archaeon]|nr:glycerol kinase GlpK [Candidatus Aenigmarchaeota archaeon]